MAGKIIVGQYKTGVGTLLIGDYGGRICMCDWADDPFRGTLDRRLVRGTGAVMETGETEVTQEAYRQVMEYLTNRRREFDLPIVVVGTDFQKAVWKAISSIPYGQVASYAHIARLIGLPQACRPVAAACGANRIAIIIPCHRVVASNGIGGYGGGVEIKRFLLWTEGSLERQSIAE
jgi:methylated-DNA-[protein]-cysteine S-methyltransferase